MIRPDNQELGLNQTYDADSLDNKVKLKMRMQQSLNLPVDSTIPMFVFLGRLDAQKGCDVMFESIDKALAGGAQGVLQLLDARGELGGLLRAQHLAGLVERAQVRVQRLEDPRHGARVHAQHRLLPRVQDLLVLAEQVRAGALLQLHQVGDERL